MHEMHISIRKFFSGVKTETGRKQADWVQNQWRAENKTLFSKLPLILVSAYINVLILLGNAL